MFKRHNNTIHKQFLKSKTIKAILSSMTRIRLTVHIKDFKEVFSMDYAHVKDTKAEEPTIVDIITTSHPVGSNIISVINLNTN